MARSATSCQDEKTLLQQYLTSIISKKEVLIMMAGLFALYSLAMIAIAANQKKTAIFLIIIGLIGAIVMFNHHMTVDLKIRL